MYRKMYFDSKLHARARTLGNPRGENANLYRIICISTDMLQLYVRWSTVKLYVERGSRAATLSGHLSLRPMRKEDAVHWRDARRDGRPRDSEA